MTQQKPLSSEKPADWLEELADALPSEEILALAFGMTCTDERLKRYLDFLRGRHDPKAQMGACLICYELGKRGDEQFEAEFLSLLPVIHEFAQLPAAIHVLIGQNAHVRALWNELNAGLENRDCREDAFEASSQPPAMAPKDSTPEIQLLDDDDVAELDLDDLDVLEIDAPHLRRAWDDAVNRWLLGVEGEDGSRAFCAEDIEDLQRLEHLRLEAASLADGVSEAAEMLPMVELFMVSHMRTKNFFGRRNRRREELLIDGLTNFTDLPFPPVHAAAWMLEPTGNPVAWQKIAEVILDYIGFLAIRVERGEELELFSGEELAEQYIRAGRTQPPPPVLLDGSDRRRR